MVGPLPLDVNFKLILSIREFSDINITHYSRCQSCVDVDCEIGEESHTSFLCPALNRVKIPAGMQQIIALLRLLEFCRPLPNNGGYIGVAHERLPYHADAVPQVRLGHARVVVA